MEVDAITQLTESDLWEGLTDRSLELMETVCGSLHWPLADYSTAWDGDQAAKELADWARKPDGTLDASKLAQCAFYRDPDGDTSKGSSYKLIFCRKGPNGPQIVPQRIFDIVGVLNGAHGGLKGVSDADQAAIKRRVTTLCRRIAKENPKKDVKIPFQESAQHSAKIGSLKIRWLRYNDRSLNGRIYPKATCDAIYRSGLRRLADPDGLPITTFVSHETANSNVNTELVGHVSKLWQEGEEFWALIDLADTRAGHDMLALVENGSLKSGSMRVLGVELHHDRNYDLPLVVCIEGVEPDLAGIDLTTRPGLANTARITQTLYESSGQQPLVESFTFENLSIESREDTPVSIPLYIQIITGTLTEARTSASRAAHMRVHDHVAGVMDSVCKPIHGSESARLRSLVEAELTEEGRAIAKKHMIALSNAHDEAAKQLGMSCECGYREALGLPAPSDTDNDGDDPAHGYDPDNDGESARQRGKTLTEAEMLAALKAKGYMVEAPKTEAEKKLAALEAQVAEQNKKIAQFTEAQPTQRQTLATPPQFEEGSTLQPEDLYQEGDLMKGELRVQNWAALSDRRVPWPHSKIDPKQALHEMSPFLAQRLLAQEANAYGRSIDQFISPSEDI